MDTTLGLEETRAILAITHQECPVIGEPTVFFEIERIGNFEAGSDAKRVPVVRVDFVCVDSVGKMEEER